MSSERLQARGSVGAIESGVHVSERTKTSRQTMDVFDVIRVSTSGPGRWDYVGRLVDVKILLCYSNAY